MLLTLNEAARVDQPWCMTIRYLRSWRISFSPECDELHSSLCHRGQKAFLRLSALVVVPLTVH